MFEVFQKVPNQGRLQRAKRGRPFGSKNLKPIYLCDGGCGRLIKPPVAMAYQKKGYKHYWLTLE